MPRTARLRRWTDAACYHVMNRGHNRETIFAAADDFAHFLALVGRYAQRFPLRLYHYCLMSNHFHLALQLQDPRSLSRLMAGLLRSYVHYFNQRYGFVGHLFQGRFKSPAIEVESYLLSCGRYIERNPLEARMVADPWQYRWSSCRAYALGEADPLLTEDPNYTDLASEPAQRQQRWREFLLGEDPKEEAVRPGDWVIGEEPFRLRTQLAEPRPGPRGPGRPPGGAREPL